MPQPQISHRVELVFGDETIELKPAGSGAAEAVMALRRDSCRWPNGDPLGDDFNFCGCKALIGRPYCETHYRVSFGLGTLAERKSVGAARKVLA